MIFAEIIVAKKSVAEMLFAEKTRCWNELAEK
jgi:hypothetical protein